MKEAQRRSPYNAMVVAPLDAFTDESDANEHGFYLMRGFVDGGENKKCFFIANTLTTYYDDPRRWTIINIGRSINRNNTGNFTGILRASTYINDVKQVDGFSPSKEISSRGNFISIIEGTPYQCCSIFAWAVISVLSLIQGQYATNTAQCAWYDASLRTNYPKGINNNTTDIDDSSVVGGQLDETQGNVFVTQGYEKTTHNGSITGITNVNGWIYQFVIGSWRKGLGTTNSKLLKRNASIYDITYDNAKNSDASFWEAHNTPNISRCWGGTKSSFPDLTGADKDLFGIYPFGGNTSQNSNEFGLDYHDWDVSGMGVLVGGSASSGTDTGIFCRYDPDWTYMAQYRGFRAMAYPNPAIGGTNQDGGGGVVPPPIPGGSGS